LIESDDQELLDLISKMLVINPRKRITAEQAMKHNYFEQLHNEDDEPKFQGSV